LANKQYHQNKRKPQASPGIECFHNFDESDRITNVPDNQV
jgi:hypothetical protein